LKKHTLFELLVPSAPVAPSRRARARARGGKNRASAVKEDKAVVGSKRSSATVKLDAQAASLSQPSTQPEPLILTLAEAEEIVSTFRSSTPNVDWQALSQQVGEGKFSPADVRLIAEEFQPAIHFRPASGMVVIDRAIAGTTEAKRRRLEVSAAKVEETRKLALSGAQASDAGRARALGQTSSQQSGFALSAPMTPTTTSAATAANGGMSAPRGSAETEFVRDVLQAAQEWIQVIPTVATRDSMTLLLIRAAQATLGQ
jgi:hypothetical protein